MLEPQSTLFFVVLLAMFAGLVWWLMKAKHIAIRIIAAFLAFVPAMVFGVATVNKYYDYYQTWGAAAADLTGSGVSAKTVTAGEGGTATGFSALMGNHINMDIASHYGLTLRVSVHGPLSNLTRTVYVFLPPQYFQAGYYQKYHFPVIELIHGFPGQPQDWITVLGANAMLDSLVSEHEAKPAVLRRVQPPGAGWGIAGYSEGGFCAANLALQHGRVYSFAGVLSGYFRPSDNQLINPVREVSPFGGNRRAAAL